MARIIEEAFHLTQLETDNITEADGTANRWSDIWDYQVPTGVAHVLQAEHTFSVYLQDTGASEMGAGTTRVRIDVADQTLQDRRTVFGPVQYVRVKEFQDSRRIARLNVARDVPVKERWHIIIVVLGTTAVDASASYFDLEMIRIREGL